LYAAANSPCVCDPNQGVCFEQQLTVNNEADCDSQTRDCVRACANDCACVDACYARHAECRAATSALAGCLVQACDSACR
jgi:hypothetical protein